MPSRFLPLFALMLLAAPVAAFPPVPKPKEGPPVGKDLLKALNGTWELIKVERGSGTKEPTGHTLRLAIDGTKLTQVPLFNGREQRTIPSTFVVDARKSPPSFEVKYKVGKVKEVTIKGVLTLKGEEMIWAYATGDGQVPTRVDAKLGTSQHRFTLTRVKK